MPVVINEFEVIAAPPPPPESAATRAEKTEAPPSATTVHDVVRVMRWHVARAERVRAH
jgi:hypothetical protein